MRTVICSESESNFPGWPARDFLFRQTLVSDNLRQLDEVPL